MKNGSLFLIIISLAIPATLPARFQRILPPPNQPASAGRPAVFAPQPERPPIKNYGKPPAPEIPAQTVHRPPAQRPPYHIKPAPPKPLRPPKPPPKPPHHRRYPYPPPVVNIFFEGRPLQYTYAWYKDSYVILYNGWFWYKKHWIWGGQGVAPAMPLWRPEQ